MVRWLLLFLIIPIVASAQPISNAGGCNTTASFSIGCWMLAPGGGVQSGAPVVPKTGCILANTGVCILANTGVKILVQ